jgi:hypothetical protein
MRFMWSSLGAPMLAPFSISHHRDHAGGFMTVFAVFPPSAAYASVAFPSEDAS